MSPTRRSLRPRPPARPARPARTARPARSRLVPLLLALALLTAACGGDATATDTGVASLTGTTDTAAADAPTEEALSDEEYEEVLLAYVACLREEGMDVADPEVDAEGNLRFQPFGGPPADGEATTQDAAGGGGFEEVRAQLEAAQEACGTPPQPAGGFGFAGGDDTELQDQALEMAQCLRDEGLDVADPDFSGATGPGQGGGPGGFGGGIDPEDPDTQALEACQSAIFGTDGPAFGAGGPGGRPGGGPGAQGGAPAGGGE